MFQTLDLGTLVTVFVVLVISITIHEAMHAFTSHWLGDSTAKDEGRITLNPIKHIDPFLTLLLPLITLVVFQVPLLAAKPVPFNPSRVRYEEFGSAIVGIVGPFTNLLLAAVGAIFLKLFQGDLSLAVTDVAAIFVIINIGLFVFNMIPIPPLDGSRLLYAFAPDPLRRVMESLEQYGIIIVFGLVVAVPGFTSFLSDLNQKVLNFLL